MERLDVTRWCSRRRSRHVHTVRRLVRSGVRDGVLLQVCTRLNVTARSVLDGNDTVSSLSTTPSRAVARTYAFPPAWSLGREIRVNSASAILSLPPPPPVPSAACRGVNFRPCGVPERLCETRKLSVYSRGVYSALRATGVNAGSLARRKCSQFAFTDCFGAASQKRVAHVCAPNYLGKLATWNTPPSPTPMPTRFPPTLSWSLRYTVGDSEESADRLKTQCFLFVYSLSLSRSLFSWCLKIPLALQQRVFAYQLCAWD